MNHGFEYDPSRQSPYRADPAAQLPYAGPAGLGPQQYWMAGQPRQSGIGVASFVIALVVGVLLFAVIVVAGYLEVQTPGGISQNEGAALAVGLAVILGMLISLVGAILGFVALLQADRKKVFAVLGLILNGLLLLGVVALMVIGTVAA